MRLLGTLRIRFSLWTAGLLLVTLSLFSILVYASMSRTLIKAVDDTLFLTAAQLGTEVDTENIENGRVASIDNFVDDTQRISYQEQGLSLRVVDPAGKVATGYGVFQDFPLPDPSFLHTSSTGVVTTYIDPISGQHVRVYSTLMVEDGHSVGILQIAQDLTHVQGTLNLLVTSLLIGVPLAVVVAGLGGYILAARALAPIDTITRTARRISAQDLSARLNLPAADDEAGRLAATFDSMLARLDRAFQRERRFVADASHELRTPLAAMQAILDGTLTRQRSEAEYVQALVDLAEETARMRTLTEGLLHLSRSDIPRPVPRDSVHLRTLLEDVADSLRPLGEQKGLDLVCDVPDELVFRGDSDGLIRLFVNLVGNAVKYTHRGQVKISAAARPDGVVEVVIQDTGIGISPEHLPHIFDRFYQVDESRNTEGCGLGLAIALNAAQAHGGGISVESELGTGTCCRVRLAPGERV